MNDRAKASRDQTGARLFLLRPHRRIIVLINATGLSLSAGRRSLATPATLKNLDLANTPITDAGLKNLKKLASLEYLSLERTSATEQGVAALRKSLPKCYINDSNLKPAP